MTGPISNNRDSDSLSLNFDDCSPKEQKLITELADLIFFDSNYEKDFSNDPTAPDNIKKKEARDYTVIEYIATRIICLKTDTPETKEVFDSAEVNYTADILMFFQDELDINEYSFLDNINAKDHLGHTPLIIALIFNNTKAVELLLTRKDVNINATNSQGCTPLHMAIDKKNTKALELLLEIDACDISITNKKGQTPLHYAIKKAVKQNLDSLDTPTVSCAIALIIRNPSQIKILNDTKGQETYSISGKEYTPEENKKIHQIFLLAQTEGSKRRKKSARK